MAVETEISEERLQYLVGRLGQYEQAQRNDKGEMILPNGKVVQRRIVEDEMKMLKGAMQLLKKAAIVETLKENYDNNIKQNEYLANEMEAVQGYINMQVSAISEARKENPDLVPVYSNLLEWGKDRRNKLQSAYGSSENFVSFITGSSSESTIDDLIDYAYEYFDVRGVFIDNFASDTKFYDESPDNRISEENEIDLAMELLNGNKNNYNTLISFENTERKLNKIESCGRWLERNKDSLASLVEKRSNLQVKRDEARAKCNEKERMYDEKGILKIFDKKTKAEIQSLHDVRYECYRVMSNLDHRIKDILDYRMGPVDIIESIITDQGVEKYNESYDNAMLEINNRKENLKSKLDNLYPQIPDKYRNVDTGKFERLVYHGRGRIGSDDKDFMLDNTRYCLQVVSMLNQLKTNTKVRNQLLSNEEMNKLNDVANHRLDSDRYNINNGVSEIIYGNKNNIERIQQETKAMIDGMVNGTIDINGQPINQNDNQNTNSRSMGFTGVPLLAFVSLIATIVVAVVGILIIK